MEEEKQKEENLFLRKREQKEEKGEKGEPKKIEGENPAREDNYLARARIFRLFL